MVELAEDEETKAAEVANMKRYELIGWPSSRLAFRCIPPPPSWLPLAGGRPSCKAYGQTLKKKTSYGPRYNETWTVAAFDSCRHQSGSQLR